MFTKIIPFCLFLITLKSNAFEAEMVKEAQRILNNLGFNAGSVDCVWGSKTSTALQGFYIKKGLSLMEH